MSAHKMSQRETAYMVLGGILGFALAIASAMGAFILTSSLDTRDNLPKCSVDEVKYNPPLDQLGEITDVFVYARGDCPGGNPRAIRIMLSVNGSEAENQGEDPQALEIGRVIGLHPGTNTICVEVAPVGDTDWSHPTVARSCEPVILPET